MTIKESIEKLGKKLTGKDIHGASISDVVSEVGDNFEGGSGGVVFNIILSENPDPDPEDEWSTVLIRAEKKPSEVAELIRNGANVSCKIIVDIGGADITIPASTQLIEVDRNVPEIYGDHIARSGIYPCVYGRRASFTKVDDDYFELDSKIAFYLLTSKDDTWTPFDLGL